MVLSSISSFIALVKPTTPTAKPANKRVKGPPRVLVIPTIKAFKVFIVPIIDLISGFKIVIDVIKVPVTVIKEVISGGIAFITPIKICKISVPAFTAGNKAEPIDICKFSTSFCKFLNTCVGSFSKIAFKAGPPSRPILFKARITTSLVNLP